MRGRSPGASGPCSGLALRYVHCSQPLVYTYNAWQVGFGVLASLPDTKEVFPLLGRPHDSLDSSGKEQVTPRAARHRNNQLTAYPQLHHRISSIQRRHLRCLHHEPHILLTRAHKTRLRQRCRDHPLLPLPHYAYVDSAADNTSSICCDTCQGPS
jgi:hypothetical protein